MALRKFVESPGNERKLDSTNLAEVMGANPGPRGRVTPLLSSLFKEVAGPRFDNYEKTNINIIRTRTCRQRSLRRA
jgi:hypothetical protein